MGELTPSRHKEENLYTSKHIKIACKIVLRPCHLSRQLTSSTTTVSRIFSDKAGAAPQSITTEDSQPRPSFLQRLQIRTSSSRKTSPAGTDSRPSSSSSRLSRSPARPATSNLNDAPMINQEATMPHSTEVQTPPSPASKRQRPANDEDAYLTPGTASNNGNASRTQSPAILVKIPAFLNKSRIGKLYHLPTKSKSFECT